MTTNIIAAITVALVTNVVTTDNSEPQPEYVFRGGTFLTQESRRTAPTEKYLTTNVLERTTVRWTWAGEQKEHVSEKLLSSVTRVLRLKQEWEQGEVRTNRLSSVFGDLGIGEPAWITITNLIIKP